MVQTDYEITQPVSTKLYGDIISQPNYITVSSYGNGGPGQYMVFTFDHTPAQALVFKKWLNTKLGLYNDSISQYTNKRGATLVYSTDTPVTLTNIGTTFKNVYTASDGMSFPIETDVYDEVKIQVHWTKQGADTGVQSLQIVDKNTPANVLASFSPLVSGSNVGSITAIPDVLKDTIKLYLIQVKSTVAADDPVFQGLRIMMR